MRTVILDRAHPKHKGAQADETLRRRLAGHLAARLREYNGEGVEDVTVNEDGVVSALVGGLSGWEAVRRLRKLGVFCEAAGDRTVFAIGAHTCFEELDYVQAAVAELL